MLAVCEDGLASMRQAITDSKEEAKKARELAVKAAKSKNKNKNPVRSDSSSLSSSESGSDSDESDDDKATPKSGLAAVPWTALKSFQGRGFRQGSDRKNVP